MKIIFILTVFITLIACQSSPTSVETAPLESESWTINLRSVSSHIYTSKGLLDKTYATLYTYVQGQLLDSSKSITIREYDGRQSLIREKEADIKKDNSIIPSSEVVQKYDSKNNLIERASYYKNRLVSKRKEVYDQQNRNIQTILVQSLTNPYQLENANQKLVYDTTYQVNELDPQGNITKKTSRDKEGNLKDTHFSSYHQGKCISAYSIDAAGQVPFRREVTKEGKLDKETTYFTGESSGTDITWRENGKVIKSLSRSTNPETKSKTEYRYNGKGDEIESISYN